MAKSKKSKKKVIVARNTMIMFITIIVIMILSFGTYVSTGGGHPSEITADNDYRVLENPRPRRPGDPITVIEYFSYGCIHCKTFDPVIKEWAEAQEDDVEVVMVPANFSPIWALLAQSYLALEQVDALGQNHNRIFRALHDAGRQFLTPEMVADYVDGRGITREEFLRAFNSPSVKRKMQDAERDQRAWGVSATPSLIVAGKYLVTMQGGQGRALQVVDHLIETERAGDST
ncbi:MAG: thiol:disulfide interchange protein DsbA/DsbL [Pseudomonadota bacterium]